MDKPDTVDLREHLHRIVSQETQQPMHIIRKVIENQFSTANEAFRHHNSIEIAGFGKFYFSQTKATQRLKNYESLRVMYIKTLNGAEDVGDEVLAASTMKRLSSVDETILFLKQKLDGFQEGVRGVEKYPAPRAKQKGSNRGNK